jgi:hypothetical protein
MKRRKKVKTGSTHNSAVLSLSVDVVYLGDEASVGDSGIEDVVEVYGEDGKETLLASGRNGVGGVSRAKGEKGQLAKFEEGKEGRPTQSKRWFRRQSFGCRECIGKLAK